MENKRFCDLVVGDKLYIYDYKRGFFEEEIIELHKYGWIETTEDKYFYKESNNYFEICETYYDIDICKAIATSMDKLLLECGDINA